MMQMFEKGGNLEMRNLTVCIARNSPRAGTLQFIPSGVN